MDSIIVMVCRGRDNDMVRDIEISPDVPADELADAIARAFKWNGVYDIQVNGKLLGRDQTLAAANVWDGAELILVESKRLGHAEYLKPVTNYKELPTIPLNVVAEADKDSTRVNRTKDTTMTGKAVKKGVVKNKHSDHTTKRSDNSEIGS